jgi:Lrp/AsnC family transcriptional regulator for asnA, asnC and gidA
MSEERRGRANRRNTAAEAGIDSQEQEQEQTPPRSSRPKPTPAVFPQTSRGKRRGPSPTAGLTRGPGRGRGLGQPDDLDRQIIALLRADGRRSNREVARRLNVPEATVRYRVRRLTDSGVLKIAASVDPEHLGYALTAVISVQVEPRRFVEASDAIAAMPEVMWLAITSGASDIVLTASFHNQEEMFAFVAERLAHVEGIHRIETSVCMRVVKKSHQWSTDLTSAVAAGDGIAPDSAATLDDDLDDDDLDLSEDGDASADEADMDGSAETPAARQAGRGRPARVSAR